MFCLGAPLPLSLPDALSLTPRSDCTGSVCGGGGRGGEGVERRSGGGWEGGADDVCGVMMRTFLYKYQGRIQTPAGFAILPVEI